MFILLIIMFATLGCLVNGFVLSVLWGWFVVPFLNLPALPLGYAIGFGLIAQVLTHEYRETTQDNVTVFVGSIVSSLLTPTISLGIGWIITWFI